MNKQALYDFVETYPNSIIADLLVHFDKATVVKFLELYQGRRLCIPSIRSIWVSHRNMAILTELKKKNSHEVRERLAKTFGLTTAQVSNIYTYYSKRANPNIRDHTIQNVVETIVRKNLRDHRKQIEKIVDRPGRKRYTLYNFYQNPEVLYLLKERQEEFTNSCMEDVNQHLVFHGRERERDNAGALLLKKIKNML